MRGCVSIPDDTLQINEKEKKIIPEYQIIDAYLENLKSEDEKVVRDTFDSLAHITFIPWLNKQNRMIFIFHLDSFLIEQKRINFILLEKEALRCV